MMNQKPAEDEREEAPQELPQVEPASGQDRVHAVPVFPGADGNAKNGKDETPLTVARQREANDGKTVEEKQAMIALLAGGTRKPANNPRDLFKQQMSQFSAENEALRKSIIDLALKLQPPPAIPQEAEDAAGRAEYIFSHGKPEDAMLDAAREYLKAIEASPNAPDAAEMRRHIAGLRYAVDKNKKQMRRRTSGFFIGTNAMYGSGGVPGKVAGKDVALKLAVNWQASPPGYQIFAACMEGERAQYSGYDLVATDAWTTLHGCLEYCKAHRSEPARERFLNKAPGDKYRPGPRHSGRLDGPPDGIPL